ncbi:MAG: LCP family protein, partial [Anaerolineae bacterium]|nr:LCP family protein [Anaerolineae bacterium]
FQPLNPTQGSSPTNYPGASSGSGGSYPVTWQNYPGPAIYPPIAVPPPLGIFPKPETQVTLLLMGSDQRPYDGSFRTDSLLLIVLNPQLGTANLVSFPRDLFVYIPGWTMERINTAQMQGGFSTTAMTFEYNFGIRPDFFALINFNGFKLIIDDLGGINVQVSQYLTDHRDGYGNYTVAPGTVHMNGDTALWYVRSRYSSSDFDRTRRQQEVLQAIFFRLLSLDAVSNASDLFEHYQDTVQTNLTLSDIVPLLPLATQLSSSNKIQRYAVSSTEVTSWTNPYNGAQVLLPNYDLIRVIMEQALNIP